MNRLNNTKAPTILYSAIIVVLCWAFLEGWFPFFRRQWVFLSVGFVVSFITVPKFFQNKRFLLLLGYALVIFLNVLTGDKLFTSVPEMLVEVFSFAFPAALLYYAYKNSKKTKQVLLASFFFVLVVSTWASFLIDRFLMPGAIRLMTALYYMEGKDAVYSYYRLGLSSYSFPHSLPMLIPPLVMGVKSKKLPRKFRFTIIFLLVSTFLLVWLSGIMTALLLTIMFLIISYFTRKGSIGSNIRRLALIFVLFLPLFSPTVTGTLARYAMGIFGEESDYYDKIENFEQGLEKDNQSAGGDWGARQNLYNKSISGFTENIIWGTNSNVGSHSSFLDRLGVLGLLGFIPLLCFFIFQLKAGAVPIPPNLRIYYFEGCIAGLMMYLLKSAIYASTTITLFVVLPLLTYVISVKETE